MTGASSLSTAAPTAHPAVDAAEAWERLRGIRSVAAAERAGLIVTADGGGYGDGRTRWRDGTPEADDLARRYLPLCLAGPHVTFAQLGQSLDGFIASRTGDADYVTGEEDRAHLHRLRALADAVVVGAGTAVADDPRLTVRACPGDDPVRVVLDPHGRVPLGHRLFTDSAAPTLWVVSADGDTDRARTAAAARRDGVDVLTLRDRAAFAPASLVRELAGRGLGRVLVEGGGVTVSRFLHEGALHRLYLTVAPVLLGDGIPGLAFPGPDSMRDALRPPTRRVTLGEDTLFELDLGTPQAGHPVGRQYAGAGQARGEAQ
ncbi:RibD family protein [Streptomyces ficellus]|uniref:RibD family protein n=1 Tax=Streptomyces ficellus TaxID=1977088 RepID=A0A6I6F0B6_9ACTN|nr:RibD family protein [Streptomyces ficellus]QGV77140.1 RibD family protein [Streptomyces ficellus]